MAVFHLSPPTSRYAASQHAALSHAVPPYAAAAPAPREDIGRIGRIGILASLALMAVFLAWAQFTQISSAVIAAGQIMVPGKPRVVQSLDGGMIRSISVTDGDRVAAGQVLMRLDPTLIKVKLDVAQSRLAAALALRSRLEAEQAGRADPVFAPEPLPFPVPDTTQAVAGQRQIFAARAALRAGRKNQLVEQLAQFGNQITGVDAQIAAAEEQLSLLESELANAETLSAKGMIRKTELLDLQSRRAGLAGQIAGSRSEKARLYNAIRDAELETGQAESSFLEAVATELRSTMTEIEELVLQIVTLSEQLARVDIRAPSEGTVHEMQMTTPGGVVAPGAVILQIVPQTGNIAFEMRLPAADLERVHVGQPAQLVFAGLDPNTTPRLEAQVATISPDAIPDPQTGQSYYRLSLSVAPDQIDRLGGIAVLPGMPVDAYLQTGDRSVMSYLLAPMSRQLMLAFRED